MHLPAPRKILAQKLGDRFMFEMGNLKTPSLMKDGSSFPAKYCIWSQKDFRDGHIFCIDSKRCLKDQLWHHDSRSTSTIKKKQCQTVSPKITDTKVTSTSKILSTNMSTEVFHKIATRPSLSIFWIFSSVHVLEPTEWWQSVDMPKSSGVCHEDAVACLQKARLPPTCCRGLGRAWAS